MGLFAEQRKNFNIIVIRAKLKDFGNNSSKIASIQLKIYSD